MKYSKTANGFFDPRISGDDIPEDAVDVSEEDHAALLVGQAAGQRIVADGNGFPVLEDQPPAPVMAVTMRQARLALRQAGLLTTVNDAVAGMEGAAGDDARIEWEYSQEVQRDKALVLALAPVLGLDDTQLDALFIAAAAL